VALTTFEIGVPRHVAGMNTFAGGRGKLIVAGRIATSTGGATAVSSYVIDPQGHFIHGKRVPSQNGYFSFFFRRLPVNDPGSGDFIPYTLVVRGRDSAEEQVRTVLFRFAP
jgi:hypothetical protein